MYFLNCSICILLFERAKRGNSQEVSRIFYLTDKIFFEGNSSLMRFQVLHAKIDFLVDTSLCVSILFFFFGNIATEKVWLLNKKI